MFKLDDRQHEITTISQVGDDGEFTYNVTRKKTSPMGGTNIIETSYYVEDKEGNYVRDANEDEIIKFNASEYMRDINARKQEILAGTLSEQRRREIEANPGYELNVEERRQKQISTSKQKKYDNNHPL